MAERSEAKNAKRSFASKISQILNFDAKLRNFGQLFNKPHPQRKGPWNRVSIAEATLIAGLKNAFYHKLNQGKF